MAKITINTGSTFGEGFSFPEKRGSKMKKKCSGKKGYKKSMPKPKPKKKK